MEQLRNAHQSTIESLKAEHEETVRSQVASQEKRLAGQTLELKATQDDLAKSKSALNHASQELETLKSQLASAHHTLDSMDKGDKDEIITQLSKDLSNLRDEHAALADRATWPCRSHSISCRFPEKVPDTREPNIRTSI